MARARGRLRRAFTSSRLRVINGASITTARARVTTKNNVRLDGASRRTDVRERESRERKIAPLLPLPSPLPSARIFASNDAIYHPSRAPFPVKAGSRLYSGWYKGAL